MGHTELTELRATHPNILLLGDVLDDVHMATGDENVIRIRVLEPRRGEVVDVPTALKNSFDAGYDLVVERDLSPVARIAGWIAASGR